MYVFQINMWVGKKNFGRKSLNLAKIEKRHNANELKYVSFYKSPFEKWSFPLV